MGDVGLVYMLGDVTVLRPSVAGAVGCAVVGELKEAAVDDRPSVAAFLSSYSHHTSTYMRNDIFAIGTYINCT